MVLAHSPPPCPQVGPELELQPRDARELAEVEEQLEALAQKPPRGKPQGSGAVFLAPRLGPQGGKTQASCRKACLTGLAWSACMETVGDG